MEPTPSTSPAKYRTLTLDEATKALILERNLDNRKSWLEGEDRNTLLSAIKKNADEVYLHLQEKRFSISYRPNVVFLKPSDGSYVPCGSFRPEAIIREIQNEQNYG
jgi:hypothetical protein